MGLPREIFTSKPDDNLTCCICYDVLERPSNLPCGHTFCEACIEPILTNSCPTCRKNYEKSAISPNIVLRGLINNLEIRCRNNNDTSDEPPEKRQRVLQDEENGVNKSEQACPWVGKLSDWESHARSECNSHLVACEWCDHKCTPKQMPRHMAESASAHMHAMMAKMQESFDEKLKNEVQKVRKSSNDKISKLKTEFEKKIKEEVHKSENVARQRTGDNDAVHSYLMSFCHQWMARKPEPLQDFLVYRPDQYPTTSLLVGIPGPKNTPWEGGMFPVWMQWGSVSRPPKCKFLGGLHHPNVYPSGLISNSFLFQEGGWPSGQPTIPEILFIIQNHISHPNLKSPSQSEAYNCYKRSRLEYDAKAQEQAAKHTKEKFQENALRSDLCFRELILVDDEAVAIHDEYDGNSECKCSCCAFRSSTEPSYWDKQRDMRLLFGMGW